MKMKKSFFAVTAIVTLFIIVIMFFYIDGLKNNNTLYIEDIYGDRSELDNIRLSGVIADQFYKSEFEFVKSEPSQKYSGSSDEYINNMSKSKEKIIARRDIDISEGAQTIETEEKDTQGGISKKIRINRADLFYLIEGGGRPFSFKTEVTYNSDHFDMYVTKTNINDSYSRTGWGMSNVDYGIAMPDITNVRYMNGRTYVFTTTGKDCRGFGGVYDITDELSNKNSNKDISLKNIAPVDLENGNVQIINMEAAQSKIVYLIVKNNQLLYRVFDIKNNIFLKDIDFGVTTTESTFQRAEPNFNISINGRYLCFDLLIDSNVNNIWNFTTHYFVLDLESNQFVFEFTEPPPTDYKRSCSHTVMKYRDSKLYIFREFAVWPDNFGGTGKPEVYITVLNNKGKLYEGRIISDVAEDLAFVGTQDNLSMRIYFRNYFNLSIE